MGIYLNPGNEKFQKALKSRIYVDKSELLRFTNSVAGTEQAYVCVSRPRRFGKSMAANMLAAYYSRDCNSHRLFSGLKISQDKEYETHLNQYDTFFLNMQDFLSQSREIEKMLGLIRSSLLWDILGKYADFRYFDNTNLTRTLQDVYQNTKRPFVIIIDEWDCVFRERHFGKEEQEKYLDFLRDLLKDKVYIQLVYMTGILPIKKYGTHSALNMFSEFSMLDAGPLAEYTGFTEEEVSALCGEYGMDLEEIKSWYDGYAFPEIPSVYCPCSVVRCIQFGKMGNYWNQTETFEALQMYIDMNYEGLKDDVLSMMAGERVPVNIGSFSNDMMTFHTEDDVLTLLVHLGYLGYDFENGSVFIPNNEIQNEYISAVSISQWGAVSEALKHSADLLCAIWQKRASRVEEGIEQAHFETSHLTYNDENALSYTISLVLYAARNYYTVYREFPTRKGFVDMVYVPKKKFPDKPALVIELKWDKSAAGAIEQIKQKQYCRSLEQYHGNLLLVGVNYDKITRKHECIIENDIK